MGNEQCCCKLNEKAGDFNKIPLQHDTKDNQDDEDPYESELKRHLKKAKDFERDNYFALSSANTSKQQRKHSQKGSAQKPSSQSKSKTPKKINGGASSREKADKNNFYFPYLNVEVKKTLDKHQFFSQEVVIKDLTKEEIPNGFGKYIRKDQSVYIGSFRKGKAHGRGVFIFSDGSYYEGFFFANQADCLNGLYHSEELTYEGGFKKNLFEGKGCEEGRNHTFQGIYSRGHKDYGVMKWTQDDYTYIYDGTFNENNEFHGRGILHQPTGFYSGEFKNGIKHGYGTYTYKTGLMYKGDYLNNRKEGFGQLISSRGKNIYVGQFRDGLPHGEGKYKDTEGAFRATKMMMGVEIDDLLQDQ